MIKWQKENKDKVREKNQRRKNDPSYQVLHRKLCKEHRLKNKEKINARQKERYHTDENYRLKKIMKAQLHAMLNGRVKAGRTSEVLGFTSEQLFKRLEDEITVYKMYGIKYELDHKIPYQWFKDDTPISISSHLDNLQMLEAGENLNKNWFYPSPVPTSYLELIRDYIRPEFLCW